MKTDGMTGNIVFLALVAALIVGFVSPVLRGELSPDALTNIAVGSQQGLLALAAAAAGYHWRGRVQKGDEPIEPLPPNGGENTRIVIPQQPPTPPVVVETNPPRPPVPPDDA